MNRMKSGSVSNKIIWVFLLCLGTVNSSWAQAVRTQVEVDSTQLLIGNPLQFTLTVDYPSHLQIALPAYQIGKELGGMEILAVDTLQQSGSGNFVRLEQRLQLTAFDSGYFKIPPQVIVAFPNGDTSQGARSQTNPLLIRFDYPTGIDTTQTFKPIKDIQDLPIGFQDIWPWLAGIALGILLIGLPIFLIFYRKAKPTAFRRPPPPPVPAHEVAMRRLAQLEAEKRWQKGDFRGYYFELSYIIRAYLEDRYQILALESTTDHILRDVSGQLQDLKQTERLKQLLQMAELAKFAKAQPEMQENMANMDIAREFVKKTQVRKEVPSAPSSDTPPTSTQPTHATDLE